MGAHHDSNLESTGYGTSTALPRASTDLPAVNHAADSQAPRPSSLIFVHLLPLTKGRRAVANGRNEGNARRERTGHLADRPTGLGSSVAWCGLPGCAEARRRWAQVPLQIHQGQQSTRSRRGRTRREGATFAMRSQLRRPPSSERTSQLLPRHGMAILPLMRSPSEEGYLSLYVHRCVTENTQVQSVARCNEFLVDSEYHPAI